VIRSFAVHSAFMKVLRPVYPVAAEER